jgi:hypothetical protein
MATSSLEPRASGRPFTGAQFFCAAIQRQFRACPRVHSYARKCFGDVRTPAGGDARQPEPVSGVANKAHALLLSAMLLAPSAVLLPPTGLAATSANTFAAPVTDNASVLSIDKREALASRLKAFSQ